MILAPLYLKWKEIFITKILWLLLWMFFCYLVHLDICDEMRELYGGGKKKEKLEASDEGSSSNQSSPLPASSPPAKKRVSIILHNIS